MSDQDNSPAETAVPLEEALAPHAERTEARKLAREQASGLRALADMIEQHAWLAECLKYTLQTAGVNLIPRGHDTAGQLGDIARIAARAGVKVTKDIDDTWHNLVLDFGGVTVKVLAYREEVCERVVVGVEKVTKTVPDPAALAAVPTVEVTETVEQVEWRCRPLLAAESEDAE